MYHSVYVNVHVLVCLCIRMCIYICVCANVCMYGCMYVPFSSSSLFTALCTITTESSVRSHVSRFRCSLMYLIRSCHGSGSKHEINDCSVGWPKPWIPRCRLWRTSRSCAFGWPGSACWSEPLTWPHEPCGRIDLQPLV